MIHYFRNVRRTLAYDNKFFKYARYAIGEIVLVVIGILIALQINNWNEERKDHKLEIEFLNQLRADMVADSTYFNVRISDLEKSIASNINFVTQLYTVQHNYAEVQDLFAKLNRRAGELTTQNPAYLELVNTGRLKLIRNTELKLALSNYYKEIEEARKHMTEFNAFTTNSLVTAFEKIPNMHRVLEYNRDILIRDYKFKGEYDYVNDPYSHEFERVEHIALIYRSKHQVFLDYFKDFKGQTNHLIHLIDTILEH